MAFLYFLILDDVSVNKSFIQSSIVRYFYHVKNLEVVTEVFNNNEKVELIEKIEKIKNNETIFYINIKYDEKITDLLDSILNKTENDFNEYNAYLLKDEIKNKIFRNIVKSFKHGANLDLVNSNLGLFKVWCDNYIILKKEFINNDIIECSIDLLEKIKKHFSINKNEYLKNTSLLVEKDVVIFYANQIQSILETGKENFKSILDNRDLMSKHIKYIFDFISKYK